MTSIYATSCRNASHISTATTWPQLQIWLSLLAHAPTDTSHAICRKYTLSTCDLGRKSLSVDFVDDFEKLYLARFLFNSHFSLSAGSTAWMASTPIQPCLSCQLRVSIPATPICNSSALVTCKEVPSKWRKLSIIFGGGKLWCVSMDCRLWLAPEIQRTYYSAWSSVYWKRKGKTEGGGGETKRWRRGRSKTATSWQPRGQGDVDGRSGIRRADTRRRLWKMVVLFSWKSASHARSFNNPFQQRPGAGYCRFLHHRGHFFLSSSQKDGLILPPRTAGRISEGCWRLGLRVMTERQVR